MPKMIDADVLKAQIRGLIEKEFPNGTDENTSRMHRDAYYMAGMIMSIVYDTENAAKMDLTETIRCIHDGVYAEGVRKGRESVAADVEHHFYGVRNTPSDTPFYKGWDTAHDEILKYIKGE